MCCAITVHIGESPLKGFMGRADGVKVNMFRNNRKKKIVNNIYFSIFRLTKVNMPLHVLI